MNISHHIHDDLLYLYAAGELEFGWNLAIATHLAMCGECRSRNSVFEDVLGASIENGETADLTVSIDDILTKAKNAEINRQTTTSDLLLEERPIFPKPLRDVAGDLNDIQWSAMGGGIRQKIIHEQDGVIARLLYIPAGKAASSHGHNGMELTQVVVGGFYDGDQAYNSGDMQIVGHAGPHQPLAMNDGPCICLAVTDAPLKFQNMLPKLLQGWFNI